MATTPTQRTLAAMKKQGRRSGIVEKFNSFIKIRQDLFGFIDIICIDNDKGIVAVQSCGEGYSEHVKKITEDKYEPVYHWLQHAPLELWAWRKIKAKRGRKAMRWVPRVADFSIGMFEEIVVTERKL